MTDAELLERLHICERHAAAANRWQYVAIAGALAAMACAMLATVLRSELFRWAAFGALMVLVSCFWLSGRALRRHEREHVAVVAEHLRRLSGS